MNAATAPRHRGVTAVGEAAGVAVVADGEHVLELLVGDHGPHPQPRAGGAFGELLGHPHIHLVQRYAVNGWDRRTVGYQVQEMRIGGDAVFRHAHAGLDRDRSRCIAPAPAAVPARYRSRTVRARWSE